MCTTILQLHGWVWGGGARDGTHSPQLHPTLAHCVNVAAIVANESRRSDHMQLDRGMLIHHMGLERVKERRLYLFLFLAGAAQGQQQSQIRAHET